MEKDYIKPCICPHHNDINLWSFNTVGKLVTSYALSIIIIEVM